MCKLHSSGGSFTNFEFKCMSQKAYVDSKSKKIIYHKCNETANINRSKTSSYK